MTGMQMKTIVHALSLTAIALGLGVLAMGIASKIARADEPQGFAEAQRMALWNAIQASPKLNGVDQIVIEGDGAGQTVRGLLMKRNWLGEPTKFERPFWARIDRICSDIRPGCFKVVGVWDGSELLAYISE